MKHTEKWEKNITALEKMLPGWGTYIERENYELGQRREVKWEKAYNGEKILSVEKEGMSYYLGGKYDPDGTAEWYANQIKKTTYGSVVLIIGFSDGRVLKKIAESIDKDATLLVYEPCIQIFLAAMEEMELWNLFESHTVGLIVQGINEKEFRKIIQKVLTIENMTKFQILVQGNYKILFSEAVQNALKDIRKSIEDIRVWWVTNIEFTNETGKNLICNFKYLYDHYTFNEFLGKLSSEIPVIVVAAGPSLDKNIEDLKKAVGHACIIACDTALKPLLRRGIRPDFFVVVDPRKPLELFNLPEINTIPMISGLNIPVEVMREHKAEKIIYYDAPLMIDMLDAVLEKPIEESRWMAPIPTGGSVATNAFSIGRLMGAKTIILIGQDLALSGEKEHAEGTLKNDRTFDKKNEKLPLVEGINGEMLPTLENLKLYLDWFEAQIQEYPELEVIDATEGGALIHGSTVMTLKETIKQKCKNKFDSREFLNKMNKHFTSEEKKNALAYFENLPKRLEKVERIAKKGVSDYRKLEKIGARRNGDVGELQKLYKRLSKVNKFMDEDPVAYMIMESLRGVEYTLRSSMYQIKNDEWDEIEESAKVGECFLESIVKAVNEMRPLYQELAEYKGE